MSFLSLPYVQYLNSYGKGLSACHRAHQTMNMPLPEDIFTTSDSYGARSPAQCRIVFEQLGVKDLATSGDLAALGVEPATF